MMMVQVTDNILIALARVVLRGKPTEEAAEIAIGNGTMVLKTWPMAIRLGPHLLQLKSICNTHDGGQEAVYER